MATGILAAALAVAAAGPASAQSPAASAQTAQPGPSAQQPAVDQPVPRAAQPYRGLFGAGLGAQPGGERLDLLVSVYEEYSNDQSDAPGATAGAPGPGWFTAARAELWFNKAGERTRVGVRSSGSARYYQDTGRTTDPRFRIDLGVAADADRRRRTSVSFDGAYEYEPYYVLPLLGIDVPSTGDVAILPTSRDDLNYRNRRDVFSQSIRIDHEFSSRTLLGVFEDLRYTKAAGDAYDARDVRAGVRFGRRLTRYAALRLGYAYRRGDYGAEAEQRMVAHDIDLSIDYQRPLPRMRRTTFEIASGATLVSTTPVERWEVIGNVGLQHAFEGGWFIQGDYSRRTRLVESFADLFFENAVTGSLGGFFSRRVEFYASGGYSRGAVGWGDEQYWAVLGSSRLRLAIARYLALDVEGLTNRHEFDERVVVPGTVAPQLSRWSVRANVSIWLPLIG